MARPGRSNGVAARALNANAQNSCERARCGGSWGVARFRSSLVYPSRSSVPRRAVESIHLEYVRPGGAIRELVSKFGQACRQWRPTHDVFGRLAERRQERGDADVQPIGSLAAEVGLAPR